jgi:hypothetical protein
MFMTSQCLACYRKALPDDKYCVHHKQAAERLTDHYKAWVNAYGSISWDDYLNQLLKRKETGSWIKEVIEIELKK